LAADFGVADRVRHLAGLSRVDSLRLQREADALLLVDWNDPSAGVIPSKIFEYMQATAPILAVGGAPHSAVGELLRKTGRGIHLGSDKSAIAAFLRKLGRPGADLRLERNDAEIRKFTVENLSLKYLELVTSRP
jgi:hypothetical protein